MGLNQFISEIKAFDRAGIQPVGKQRQELIAFYLMIHRKAHKLFGPDRLDMILRVLYSYNFHEINQQYIELTRRFINRAIGEGEPLRHLELAPPHLPLNTKKQAEIAKYYFEEGLRLGKSVGALTDPVRVKALAHTKNRQKSTSYWSDFYPEIEKSIAKYIAGDISSKEKLRNHIGNTINPRKFPPAKSTLSSWIFRYEEHGDIAKGLPRSKSRK